MKVRDSGMPERDYWETLFDIPSILAGLEIDERLRDVVELGCGYGSFTLPVAQRIRGTLHTYDIDPAMAAQTQARVAAAGLRNVSVNVRDVLAEGFNLPSDSADAALLFNILHAEQPVDLLRLSASVLPPGGRVFVIHWRSEVKTPRGPDLAIRPRPEQVVAWAEAAGLKVSAILTLPPWHYGVILAK